MKKSISIFIISILIFVTVLPHETFAADEVQTVNNDMYNMTLPLWAKLLNTSSESDLSTVISDKELNFTFKISFEKITDDEMNIVRDYLGDYTSNNNTIIDKIIDLKSSSYDAAEKSFENSSLFYPLENDYSEYNFKIIDKQTETLFGARAFSIMYNTLDATLNNVNEFSKTDFYIPSYDNTGIYNINIIIARDSLDVKIIMKLSELLASLELKNQPKLNTVPRIYIDSSNIEKASSGIYPAFTFKNYNLKPYYSKDMGISFLYPDFLIPTEEVTNFFGIQTASFKIDPFTNFNISISDSNFYSLDEAISAAFTSVGDNTVIEKTNTFNSHIGDITELKYSYIQNNIKYSKTTYLMSDKGRTVTYTFTSSAIKPAYSIDNIAIRILMTTKIFDTPYKEPTPTYDFITKEFGNILVNLPMDYQYEDIGNNTKRVFSPDISAFKIYFYEDTFKKNIDFESASRLASTDYDKFANNIKKTFTLPYVNNKYRYLGGSFDYSDTSSKVIRLVKYLDENNRVHYCYLVGKSKKNVLYSMLIDVNTAALKEDGYIGKTLPGIFNEIIRSFDIIDK